jgi:hypothetical protein
MRQRFVSPAHWNTLLNKLSSDTQISVVGSGEFAAQSFT